MSDAYRGALGPQSGIGDYNALVFAVTQLLTRNNHSTLVQVVNVTNAGDDSPVGFVDVKPLVAQLDGEGKAVAHGVIHHIPYMRLQGGADAVIIDPKQGDIGICIFADRDISGVKNNKGAALPGSRRQFDMSDGLYMGGFLNGTPTQYIQFNAGGITAVSPTKITCQAPTVELDATTAATIKSPQITLSGNTTIDGAFTQGKGSNGGAASLQGPLSVTGDVTASGTSVHTHTHSGVTPGSSNTGAPV